MDGSAKFVDCSVRSSVRKNPGLTIVVLIPNGATSACNDSIQPSSPNFEAAYAVPNLKPDNPADDEIEIMWPERCSRITGKTERVTFIGPIRLAANCRSIC